MKSNQSPDKQLTFGQRIMHLIKAFGLALVMFMVVLYGFSLTTNVMTQLNHYSTSFYVTVFITCYLSIGCVFAILYLRLSKHIMQAAAGFK